MFVSPIAYCAVCESYVALDQAQLCTRLHGRDESKCPLQRFFTLHCPVWDGYVVLHQTPGECAREHDCNATMKCPLQRFFTGTDFSKAPPHSQVDEGPAR